MSTSSSKLSHAALPQVMPRHATLYIGLALGIVALAVALWLAPQYAISIGANGLFVGFLASTSLKLPHLTAAYLNEHAREEDTPAFGIVLIVLLVVVASVISLILALASGGEPDPIQVASGVASVLLGWFTVQVLGALHYAYEYYQAPDEDDTDDEVAGGLDFPGDEAPNGVAFMYYSFTVGTSVATSDTKVTSNSMRRRVLLHLVFSHFYNTILLAAAVNVLLSLGSGGGG